MSFVSDPVFVHFYLIRCNHKSISDCCLFKKCHRLTGLRPVEMLTLNRKKRRKKIGEVG